MTESDQMIIIAADQAQKTGKPLDRLRALATLRLDEMADNDLIARRLLNRFTAYGSQDDDQENNRDDPEQYVD